MSKEQLQIIFLVNDGPSMHGQKWKKLKDWFPEFIKIRDTATKQDRVSVIQFSDKTKTVLENQPLGAARGLNLVRQPKGQFTNFDEAFKEAKRIVE